MRICADAQTISIGEDGSWIGEDGLPLAHEPARLSYRVSERFAANSGASLACRGFPQAEIADADGPKMTTCLAIARRCAGGTRHLKSFIGFNSEHKINLI